MDIDQKIIESCCLLKRHLMLLEKHRENQPQILSVVENALESNKEDKSNEVLDLFNYVFLFVDLAARIYKIAHIIPRLSQKTSEFKAFESEVGKLKKIRNRFQHINEEVSADGKDHILGTISWPSNSRIFVASLQDISRNRNGPSIPFEVTDSRSLKFNYEICYVFEDEYYELNKIYVACKNFGEYLDAKIELRDENGILNVRAKYDVWAVQLTEVEDGVEIRKA